MFVWPKFEMSIISVGNICQMLRFVQVNRKSGFILESGLFVLNKGLAY